MRFENFVKVLHCTLLGVKRVKREKGRLSGALKLLSAKELCRDYLALLASQ